MTGARSLILASYGVPADVYAGKYHPSDARPETTSSARRHLIELWSLIRYASDYPHTGRKSKIPMDIDKMVARWHKVVLGLATAHSKDDADRFEAGIEECLAPILTAPIKQIREFGRKLAKSLENDPAVPWLVWVGYHVWISAMVENAADEAVITLKTELAAEIAKLVETDAKDQLTEAITRALQWRNPEQLTKLKQVIESEKAVGKKVRLRGRESCLFLEAGGTEQKPEICVQV